MDKEKASLIQEFSSITGEKGTVARRFLSDASFSLSDALTRYYADNSCSESDKEIDRNTSVDKFFDSYSDKCSLRIEPEGIHTLSGHLGIDTLDVVWIIIAFNCQAKSMGTFTKAEWIRGMNALNCMECETLKKRLPSLRRSLNIDEEYTKIYDFAFTFALDQGARNISLVTATALWSVILPFSGWNLASIWLEFIQSDKIIADYKAVTKDVWNMLLVLKTQIPDRQNLGAFDRDGGAWPLLIDEFYDTVSEI